MICPKCGARYPREFSECTQCEVRLVAEPSADEAAPVDPERPATAPAAEGGLFCPECGAEYRQGVTECSDCEVPLGDRPPPEPPHPEPDLVEVTKTSDPALLPVLVSVLESAGIEPVVEGDEIMGVLPVGHFGGGKWSADGRGLNVVIRVPRERAEEARALLTEVEESGADEMGEAGDDDGE